MAFRFFNFKTIEQFNSDDRRRLALRPTYLRPLNNISGSTGLPVSRSMTTQKPAIATKGQTQTMVDVTGPQSVVPVMTTFRPLLDNTGGGIS